MKALLTFQNALVLWDSNRGDLVLHSGQGTYYGVTWDYEQLYVVARRNRPSRMKVFSRNMYPLSDLPFEMTVPGDDGPHQAYWHPGKGNDGVLYVTNTQRNRIEVLYLDSREVYYFYPSDQKEERDIDHVNSIWFDPSDRSFYIVEHRKHLLPKHIHVFNEKWQPRRTIELDLRCLADGPTHSGLHNVFVEGRVLYTLGPSQVILVDLKAQGEPIEVCLPGVERNVHYLRGLARSQDYFFIGMSLASSKGDRGYGTSSVLVLDKKLNVIDKIDFVDKRYGQIMEIRLVDVRDYAHNLVPCPLNSEVWE